MSFNEDTSRTVNSSTYEPSVADTTQSSMDPRLTQPLPGVPATFQQKAKERTSWVWRHGSVIQSRDKNGVVKDRWRCNLCPNQTTAVSYSDTTTKNAINHLVRAHGFHQNGELRDSMSHIAGGSQTFDGSSSQSATNNPIMEPVKIIFNSDIFKQLYVRWIISNNIPFQQAVSPTLRYLLMYLCAVQASYTELGRAMPKSHTTVSSWVNESFLSNQNSIRYALSNSISSIHLSFDLWTSPNNLALLAVVAYWLNEDGILNHALLGLRRLLGAHSGENQGSIVWTVIKDYQIENSLGFFTLDNAGNNITALRFIDNHINRPRPVLLPEGSTQSRATTNLLTVEARYVRCYGHILNLVVKVFLYGKKSLQLLSPEDKKLAEKENVEIEKWRKIGPLGKLRNITVWIQGSPQRREAFYNSVTSILGTSTQAKALILGNVTRWTGDYDGLERALKLRHAIDFHVHQLVRDTPGGKPVIEKDQLTPSDWVVLEEIFIFLEPFRDETLALEGHRTQGSLYDIYPSFELLRRHIQDTQRQVQSPTVIASLQLASQKLEKYYSIDQLSPIICASIVLHPDMDNFFDHTESGWGDRPDWGIKARALVKSLWESSYKPIQLHSTSTVTPHSPKRTLDPNTYQRVRTFKKPRLDPDSIEDELTRYLHWVSQNRHEIGSPIPWWINARPLYPRLSIFALDAFSTPAMSAECERVFSSAKQSITDRRNRLDEGTIEAGECQKSWARAGLITFNQAGDISDFLARSERDSLTARQLKN